MDDALCGVGGGPRLVDPVEEEEGDFFIGDPVFEELLDAVSFGGGGNSGDCTTPPGCHFGLALTAGGDWGALDLDPSVEVDIGRVDGGEFPGNWLTICLTSEDVAAAMDTDAEDAEGDRAVRFLEERLCCLGKVGGG